MPCNTDYMEPSSRECQLSKVACLLDELNGEPINKTYWQGYHPKVYSQTYDIYTDVSEGLVETLIKKLEQTDVTKYSLEMQMWWRDYQELKL